MIFSMAKMANRMGGSRPMRFKGRAQLNGVTRGKPKRTKVVGGGVVRDARQKILLKKRSVGDAREILAKAARLQDARSKIEKIRQNRSVSGGDGSIRPIGGNILRKTDRNGKITLMTNKKMQQPHSDGNLVVKHQLGLLRSLPVRGRKGPVTSAATHTKASISPLLRKTVINDLQRTYAPPNISYRTVESEMYDYCGSTRMGVSPLRSVPVRSEPIEPEPWGRQYHKRAPQTIAFVDLDVPDDEEMPMMDVPTKSLFPRSQPSGIHSRLDAAPVQVSHGIFAASNTPPPPPPPTKTKVIVPVGHRIVVSNLQSTVTQEDIRELFEDIGQLLVARLVRPGTAEVIYKNLRDAQKAVETYHNRQLDGQPMKCLLVNKRPINNPTGPALTPARMEALEMMSKKTPAAVKGEKVIPDLQTIHKVLFKGK